MVNVLFKKRMQDLETDKLKEEKRKELAEALRVWNLFSSFSLSKNVD